MEISSVDRIYVEIVIKLFPCAFIPLEECVLKKIVLLCPLLGNVFLVMKSSLNVSRILIYLDKTFVGKTISWKGIQLREQSLG